MNHVHMCIFSLQKGELLPHVEYRVWLHILHDNWILQRVAEATKFEALQFFNKLSLRLFTEILHV